MSTPSKEVLDRIRANGQQVRAAATELTKRIKTFEDWLGKLPGRVAASCKVATNDEGDESTHLGYFRRGKDWALVVYRVDDRRGVDFDEVLLRDAPVETKIWMVEHFNELLESMAKNQVLIVKRARDSSSTYDAFAGELGIKEGA